MMTIVCFSGMSSVKPSRTRLGPNALCTSISWIMAPAISRAVADAKRGDLAVAPPRRRRRPPSGGEAAERAPDVALAQPLERAVAELAHALARDAEHRADLL